MTCKEYSLTLEDYTFLMEKTDPKEQVFPMNEKNLRWIELGKKYGFDPYTVKQLNGSYYKFEAEEN